MKKILLLLFATVSYGLYADIADPTPFEIVQPNGDTIIVVQKGDEFVSWYETIQTKQVINKDTKGVWKYVQVHADSLRLTETVRRVDFIQTASIAESVVDNKAAIMEVFSKKREAAIAYRDSIANTYDMEDSITAQYIAEHGLPVQTKGLATPLPTKGKMKILTVLVDFKDIKFKNPAEVRQQFENIMNTPNCNGASVKDFYRKASYGQLDLTSTVVGPYTIDAKREYFGKERLGINDAFVFDLVRRAVKKAANDVNMKEFDNDGDGNVEGIHIVFAGEAGYSNSNSIWPHQGAIHPLIRDWVVVSRYMITPELQTKDKYSTIGVICHELGHILGAPDFYDTDDDGSGGDFNGTGYWDLMASGNHNNFGLSPAHPNPYIKTQLFRWTEAKELTGTDSLYTVKPSEQNAQCIYKVSTPDGGYYLLENRQDSNLYGQGLVIFHIHRDIAYASTSKFYYKNNVNRGHPQKCYVVDASSDLKMPTGTRESYGSTSMAAFPGPSYSPHIFFTSTSRPSNAGWDGRCPQGRDIAFIREEGDNIKFVLNPSISGPSTLCSRGAYSIPVSPVELPDVAKIDWGYEGELPWPMQAMNPPLKIVGGEDADTAVYERGGETVMIIDPDNPQAAGKPALIPYVGEKDITSTVTCNGDSCTMTRRVTMPAEQDLTVSCDDERDGMSIIYLGGTDVNLSLKEPSGRPHHIRWVCRFDFDSGLEGLPENPDYTETYYGNRVKIPTYPTFGGTLTVTVSDIGAQCNPGKSVTWSRRIIPSVIHISHSNPASGSVDIALSRTAAGVSTLSSGAGQGEPYTGAYRLELWHDRHGLVRSIDSGGGMPSVTLGLGGLAPDIYYIRLIIGGSLHSVSKLMVR